MLRFANLNPCVRETIRVAKNTFLGQPDSTTDLGRAHKVEIWCLSASLLGYPLGRLVAVCPVQILFPLGRPLKLRQPELLFR